MKTMSQFSIRSNADITGLTPSEKAALVNALRVIKRHFRIHALVIFLDFFTEHHTFLEHFRKENNRFNLFELSTHPLRMLEAYEDIIDHGLDDYIYMHTQVVEMGTCHAFNHVLKSEISLMNEFIRDYFIKLLEPISSPTLVSAFNNLAITLQRLFDISMKY